MKRLIIIIIFLTIGAGCGGGGTDYNHWLNDPHYLNEKTKLDEKAGECQVVLIGDSRIEWGPFDDPEQEWCNYGIGGDVTWGVENRLTAVIEKQPGSFVIQVGRNDLTVASRDVLSTFLHYKNIIDTLLDQGFKVFVTSTLPDGESSFITNSMIFELNRLLEDYCETNQAIYVDLCFMLAPDGYLVHTNDGVHPNATGYSIFVDLVAIALI